MIKRLYRAPDPHIQRLLSISINRLQELQRSLALRTFFDLSTLTTLHIIINYPTIRSVHWTYSLSIFLWLEQVEQVVLS
jgi:hypothetical protein